MGLDWQLRRRRRRRNILQSLLLLGGMVALLAACGWIIAGLEGLLVVGVFALLALWGSSRLSPRLVLQLFRAQPLPPGELNALHRLVALLSERAGLARTPRLYYVSSPTMNAFSVGRPDEAAVAVTTGLLRAMDLRELAGVLAHEVSHIVHNDMWVMGLADVVTRLTRSMSFLGLLLLALNLPLVMTGAAVVPWLLVLLMVFAPAIGTLLQLALSRTREFDADLEAATLTGDPAGLASALQKMERYQSRFWEDILLPGRRVPDPSILRSHPHTAERVRRLLELRGKPRFEPLTLFDEPAQHHAFIPESPRRPRWRRWGTWY